MLLQFQFFICELLQRFLYFFFTSVVLLYHVYDHIFVQCHACIRYMSDGVEPTLLSSKSISHEESWNHDSTEVNGHAEDPTKTSAGNKITLYNP